MRDYDPPKVRDEARVAYPVFTTRCETCGHWEDDHTQWGPKEHHYCSTCNDLLAAHDKDPETYAEPKPVNHPFVAPESPAWSDVQRTQWHINVYELDRAYGGAEEGGWWYDCGELIHTIPVMDEDITDDEIEKLCDLLEKIYPAKTDYDVGSVLYSGGAYAVVVEPKEGESYPQERPRYE